MQNLEVVASKFAKLWLFSLRLDIHLLKCYTQAVWLGGLDNSIKLRNLTSDWNAQVTALVVYAFYSKIGYALLMRTKSFEGLIVI